jgi:hypothetical protein
MSKAEPTERIANALERIADRVGGLRDGEHLRRELGAIA